MAIVRRWVITRTRLPLFAGRLTRPPRTIRFHLLTSFLLLSLALGVSPAQLRAQKRPPAKPTEPQLAQLARSLRDEETPAAYAKLADFARRNAASELGARAALALGYYDFTNARHQQAKQWLEQAARDGVTPRSWPLREYLVYWRAQTDRALGQQDAALAGFEQLRRDFPDSVMSDQAVQGIAELALSAGAPDRALKALAAYSKAASKPSLLLLWAEALDRSGSAAEAARRYQDVYFGFPLSDEAKAADRNLSQANRNTGDEKQKARAAAFYDAHRWRDARAEYENLEFILVKGPSDLEYERVKMRAGECRVQLGAPLAALASLELRFPEVDAERLYRVSQFQRAKKQDYEMFATVDQLAARYPQSPWTEEALFATGNYFWVNLDRARAASYYGRAAEQFPNGRNARNAHWRTAWIVYLDRKPEAAGLLEDHIRRYPGSPYTQDALYWLGRVAERSGNAAQARSFYRKTVERFPLTYFGRKAAERLRPQPVGIGAEPVSEAEFLALIPAPPPLPQLDEQVPPGVARLWERAQALRTIAFDASAELELRAGYAESSAPRLLWEAARAALDADRYTVAVALTRQIYPQIESHRFEEIPPDVWRTLYPLPFETSLRRAAARQHVDPMLVAGLIRQESGFQPEAVSHAGAVGLMQVLPKTGAKLSKRLKLRYSRPRLFNPEYNLQLGTLYLADLLETMDGPEKALAAFNAGEDRVAAWQDERAYEEPAEFVESIPFTETREYVQIVMRNADLYRRVYGSGQ